MACLNGKANIRKQIIVNYIFLIVISKYFWVVKIYKVYVMQLTYPKCYNKNNLTLYLYQKPLYLKAIFKGLFSLDAVYS